MNVSRIWRLSLNACPKLGNLQHIQQFSIFPRLQLKEIQETRTNNELIISGVTLPSPREPYMIKTSSPTICAICSSGLDIKHTDVLILSQFVRTDGCMLPRRTTRLCRRQQKRVATLVAMAQKAAYFFNAHPSFRDLVNNLATVLDVMRDSVGTSISRDLATARSINAQLEPCKQQTGS